MTHSCALCIMGLYEGDECASVEPGWLDLSEKGNHPYFLECNSYLSHAGCVDAALESQLDPTYPVLLTQCALCHTAIDLEEEVVRVRWGILRDGKLEETPGVFSENFFHVPCLSEFLGEDCVTYEESPE